MLWKMPIPISPPSYRSGTSSSQALISAAAHHEKRTPRVIKIAGVSAVLARGFARIFFRNAINIGLPVVECDTSLIEGGDELEVDLAAGTIRNMTKEVDILIAPLPGVMVELLKDGGLVEHFKRYRAFNLRSVT